MTGDSIWDWMWLLTNITIWMVAIWFVVEGFFTKKLGTLVGPAQIAFRFFLACAGVEGFHDLSLEAGNWFVDSVIWQ